MTLADVRSRFRDPTAAELQLIAKYGELPEDARRARAFEAFAQSGLPHRRMEQWKWTDFRSALKSIEQPAGRNISRLTAPDTAMVLRFDGHSWHLPDDLEEGLSIQEKPQAPALGDAEHLPMAALTASLTGHAKSASLLQIEVSKPLTRPIFLDFDATGKEMAFSRVAFVIRPEASLDVIEQHTGGAGLSSVVIEFSIQKNAGVKRTLFQSGGMDEAAAITGLVSLEENASYKQTALAFGAKLARIETRVVYLGPHGVATLNAAYLPGDGMHVDLTSHIHHGAESCVTRQLTKGAVAQGGRGVFQGKFHVPRMIGQYTDADMQHQALLLDHGAEVFAKPELEIYADDVECAHGNTSGQLDETALFYMRQRGIPLNQARAMLTGAFIAEALAEGHPDIVEALISASRDFLRMKGQD